MRATRSSSRQHPTSLPDDFSSPLFFLLFFLSAWVGVLDCTLLVFRERRWSESLGRRSCNPISLYKPRMEFRTGPDLVVSCNKTGVITFLSDDRWDFFQGLLKEIGVKHGDYNQDHIAVDLRMNVGREQACKEINITARARDKSLCMQSCSDVWVGLSELSNDGRHRVSLTDRGLSSCRSPFHDYVLLNLWNRLPYKATRCVDPLCTSITPDPAVLR